MSSTFTDHEATMPERLVVPLDMSPSARSVVPYVAALACGLQLPVVLLSVLPDITTLGGRSTAIDSVLADMDQARLAEARQYLDDVRAELDAAGVAATTLITFGSAPEMIVTTAGADGRGLIVMATHGQAGVEHPFLGSVSDKVVRSSHGPVLLVRADDGDRRALGTAKEIVVPLDGSTVAEAALPHAEYLARTLGARVTLIRALPPNLMITHGYPQGTNTSLPAELLTMLKHDAERYLERVAQQLRNARIDVSTRFGAVGSPAAEIIEATRDMDGGTLVVMATHGESGLGRPLLGSVTDRVIRSSRTPVLVVRGASGPAAGK